MKAVWIRRIYHILLTAATVVAAICLMAGAIYIYRSGGPQTYTLEKVQRTFKAISVPVYIALVLVFGSFITELFLPAPKKKKPEKNYAMILHKLQPRAQLDKCGDKELTGMILRLRKQRKVLAVLSAVILAVTTVFFLIYALFGTTYPSVTEGYAVTQAMIKNAIVWAVCLLIPFLAGTYTAYITRSSMQTEIDLLRHVALQKAPPKATVQSCKKQLFILRGSLIVLAVALIVVGAIGDGWYDVLTKAANICTECVGLG